MQRKQLTINILKRQILFTVQSPAVTVFTSNCNI